MEHENDNASNLEALYWECSCLASEEERAKFLDENCEGRPTLRAQLEGLLSVSQDADRLAENLFPHVNLADDKVHPHGEIIGPYKLLQVIGQGGMGTVYMAEQIQPVERRVALKIIKPGMDTRQVIARFEAERQALAMMDHPHIAKVLDAGTTISGLPYFVMELVKGMPITKYCDDKRLGLLDRLKLFLPVCQAIQHAHQKGIIHRDVKPGNVLVALYDGRPVPKVIDFGVAKATAHKLTQKTMFTEFGQVIGTLEYMSPEQAELNQLDIDTRTDIYSLGVLLYELLTGTTPLDRQRLRTAAFHEMLRMIREEDPPKPSTRLSTSQTVATTAANRSTEPARLGKLVRGELDWIVMKTLAKERERRYETANALAWDIEKFLTHEPVSAGPPTLGYRLRKFTSRHRAKVLAGSIVLLALLVGIVGASVGLIGARRQAEQARAEADAKEQARASAVLERKRAIEFRDLALDALRATTGTDVEKLIGERQQLGSNERAYLESIAQRWQAFAQHEGTDEQSRVVRAEGHQRVADLWVRLGRHDEARSEYELSKALWQQLATDFPNLPQYVGSLASLHIKRGDLLGHLGLHGKAEQELRHAQTIFENLATVYPEMPEWRSDLATSHNDMGVLLDDLGKHAEAEQHFRQAMAIREQLSAEFPGRSDYRNRLASSHNNLGTLLDVLGRHAEAEQACRKAIAIREQLANEFPTTPDYRSDLASSHLNLGSVLRNLERRRDAEDETRRALSIYDELADEFPNVPDYRNYLARTCNNLAILLTEFGNREQAESEYRHGLVILEKLTDEFPGVLAYRSDLANIYNELGGLLVAAGDLAEAEQHNRKAVAIWEKLSADASAMPYLRMKLAGSYCNLGHLARQSERPSESLAWFQKAIETLELLSHIELSDDTTARTYLRNSHAGRAEVYNTLKQHVEAERDWEKAIELSSPRERSQISWMRAMAKVGTGQVDEAVAQLANLTNDDQKSANDWYGLARVCSVASDKSSTRKQEYVDQAMAALRDAVKAGWKDVAYLKRDSFLEPLHGRDDFKQLVESLKESSPGATPSTTIDVK